MTWKSEEYKNGNPPSGRFVVECDQCGFDYYKDTLRRSRGLLVCHNCYDQRGYRELLGRESDVGPVTNYISPLSREEQ